MPRVEPLFLRDFLYPSLRRNRFPGLLQWTNEAEKEYEVKWSHKSSGGWQVSEFEHFAEWDRLKGNYSPESAEYWTLSKQRFRNTHRKLEIHGKVKRLPGRRGYRKYKICSSSEVIDKRKENIFEKPQETKMKSRRPVILKVGKAMQAYQTGINETEGLGNTVFENAHVTSLFDLETDNEQYLEIQDCFSKKKLESDNHEAFLSNAVPDTMTLCIDINDPLLSMFPSVFMTMKETVSSDDKENHFAIDEGIGDMPKTKKEDVF
ncbi:interferon regulatory factor 1-like [Limulus polyphemus]|uniref:Interferon regulatory factor 1-like n=1 Tax=Limulus polyphemus TaxID=6850 RepID=A0ABM1B1P7_LIMPO|nr:interferon regulatory factor 1-like [Limulus polyphemus]XP_022239937.1 interferon regulatory factor 1-like [Limulus polyphemus]XP_022239938.1 interferon regulatory factor 1-like [Limulus polyphemus]